jgi:hypothetical protein
VARSADSQPVYDLIRDLNGAGGLELYAWAGVLLVPAWILIGWPLLGYGKLAPSSDWEPKWVRWCYCRPAPAHAASSRPFVRALNRQVVLRWLMQRDVGSSRRSGNARIGCDHTLRRCAVYAASAALCGRRSRERAG